MSDTTDPTAEEFPMMVTEAKLHTTSNTGDVDALADMLARARDEYTRVATDMDSGELAERVLASDWLADLIAAAERRGANQRAQKIAAAMETASHTHRPDRPIWLHAARIARNTR